MYRCAPPSSAHRTSRDGGGPLRRPALGLIAALLAVTVTACVGGPAANRAGLDDSSKTGPDATGDPTHAPTEDPTDGGDGATEEPPTPSPSPSLTELDPPPAEGTAEEVAFHPLDEVADPTAVAVLPGGDALIGSREGVVYRVEADSGEVIEVGSMRAVVPQENGGLMGLAVEEGEYVYGYYTSDSDSRIRRFPIDTDRPPGDQLLSGGQVMDGLPEEGRSNGGTLAIGPDGMLYAATRDSTADERAGALLRMSPSGDVPDLGNATSDSLIYQVLAGVQDVGWDPLGRIWTITAYGAVAAIGTVHGGPEDYGVLHEWDGDDVVPRALAYSRGSLWIADASEPRLWRLPLDGIELAAEPQQFSMSTTVRALRADADGRLWALTDSGLSVFDVS